MHKLHVYQESSKLKCYSSAKTERQFKTICSRVEVTSFLAVFLEMTVCPKIRYSVNYAISISVVQHVKLSIKI